MRFIYNTTFLVENEIEEAFIRSIHDFYIPHVQTRELCHDILFTRVLVEEENGKSFSLQLVFPNAGDYSIFMEFHKDKLLGILTELFGQQLLYFNTTLEEI